MLTVACMQTSKFTRSTFGDTMLMFTHGYMGTLVTYSLLMVPCECTTRTLTLSHTTPLLPHVFPPSLASERDLAKNPDWQKETDMEKACGAAVTHSDSETHRGRERAGSPCPYAHVLPHDLPSSLAAHGVGRKRACPFLRAQARQKELELDGVEGLQRELSTSPVALG